MVQKKESKKAPPANHRRETKVPLPGGANQDPDKRRDEQEQDEADRGIDKREIVRQNAKPRSARQSQKGPNNRKASTSRKGG